MIVVSEDEKELARQFLEAMLSERRRAHAKHGKTSMEQAGCHEHRRASILTEEAVECARALNDFDHLAVTLWDRDLREPIPPRPDGDGLDRELIQTASMAFTWWANRRGNRLPAPQEGTRETRLYGLLKATLASREANQELRDVSRQLMDEFGFSE